MKLILSHHHLKAKTPNKDRVSSLKSSLEHWANDQLPMTLGQKLSQSAHWSIPLSDTSYVCIRKLHIKMLLKMRHGLMQTDIDRWADAIMSAIMSSLTTESSQNVRFFGSEAEYIARYIMHVLAFNRAVDWPFEPHYDRNLSAVDNSVSRLVEKASLMTEVFQELQRNESLSRLLSALNNDSIAQLVHSLGAPEQFEILLSSDLGVSIFDDFLPLELLKIEVVQPFHILLLAAVHFVSRRKQLPSYGEWHAIYTLSQLIDFFRIQRLPEDTLSFIHSEFVVENKKLDDLFKFARHSEVHRKRLTTLIDLVKSLFEKLPELYERSINNDSVSLQKKTRVVDIRYGGLCFVMAALLRHPLAEGMNGELLWYFCCHAVPEELRPLATSDHGLRNLCLGNVVWEEGSLIQERVIESESFKRFCQFERIDRCSSKISETLHAFVMRQFASFLNGFEKTTSEGLFHHFVNFSAEFEVQSKSIQCRVEKMSLSVVISLSPFVGEQPELPCWPNKQWLVQWKS